jgi:hypothetical protein
MQHEQLHVYLRNCSHNLTPCPAHLLTSRAGSFLQLSFGQKQALLAWLILLSKHTFGNIIGILEPVDSGQQPSIQRVLKCSLHKLLCAVRLSMIQSPENYIISRELMQSLEHPGEMISLQSSLEIYKTSGA